MNVSSKTRARLTCGALLSLSVAAFGVAANAQSASSTSASSTSASSTAPAVGLAGESDLTLLNKALAATGLDATLKSGGYTIFAPRDGAFGVLPSASIQTLLKPENKAELTKILLQHVVKGTYSAGDIARSVAGVGAARPREATVTQVSTRLPTGQVVVSPLTVNPPPAPVPAFAVAYPVDQFVDKAYSGPFVASETNPSPGVFVTVGGTRIVVTTPVVQEGSGGSTRAVQRIFFGPGHVTAADIKADGNTIHKIDTVVIKP